jgi:hypothetical protein
MNPSDPNRVAVEVLDDEKQAKLVALIQTLKRLERSARLGANSCPAILAFAAEQGMGAEELYQGLIAAGVPKATASDCSSIHRQADLSSQCAAKAISVREALRQARQRNKGEPATEAQQHQLLGAMDRFVERHAAEGQVLRIDCGDHYLLFLPKEVGSAAAQESEKTGATPELATPGSQDSAVTVPNAQEQELPAEGNAPEPGLPALEAALSQVSD